VTPLSTIHGRATTSSVSSRSVRGGRLCRPRRFRPGGPGWWAGSV